MKKILLLLFLLCSPQISSAVEVGDIYYSNKTFNSELLDGLVPIGIVWQVNDNKDKGLIMSLEQPGSKNWEKAKTYCRVYQTRGTKSGDWFLPDFLQLFPINKLQQQRVGAHTFLHLNQKLEKIKSARPLKEDTYLTSSDYAEDKASALGVHLASGDIVKVKKKSRNSFRCMMAF